jgi:hypothetical protein
MLGENANFALRELLIRLRDASYSRNGTSLRGEDLDVVLAALRAIDLGPERFIRRPVGDMFQIELLDDDGWPIAALASIAEERIARAVFDDVQKREPAKAIRLRRGATILAITVVRGEGM